MGSDQRNEAEQFQYCMYHFLNPRSDLDLHGNKDVGTAANRPTCDSTPFPNDLSSLIEQYTVVWEYGQLTETYKDVTQLCLHRYYGGHNFTTFGGICLHPGGGESRLSFPYTLRATVFTNDWPRSSNLHNFLFPVVVQQFCETRCWCGARPKQPIRSNTTLEVTARKVAQGRCDDDDVQDPACKKQKLNVGTQTDDSGIYAGVSDLLNSTCDQQTATCSGNCSTTNNSSKPTCPGEGSCKCTALQPMDPLGFDSAKFVTTCLSIIAAGSEAGQRVSNSKRPGIGGEGANKRRDRFSREIDSQVHSCPCNQTYVSKACCFSDDDGLVWEAPHMKLGEVK